MRMYQGTEDSIKAYVEDMSGRVLEGVVKANERYEQVTLRSGKTSVYDLSFNRRLVKKDGSIVMNFEEFELRDILGASGPVDEELITLSVWDTSGNLFALLVNFTLHPAILVGYQWLISRDFINYMDQFIQDKYGKDVVTLFANGAEGNINHLNYQDPAQLRSFEEAERVGKKLGAYVSDSIRDSKALDGKIRFITEKVTLPLREITEEEKEWAEMVLLRDKDLDEDMLDGIPDKTYAKMIKGMLVRTDKAFETVLQGMAIHNFALVTFPGEVYVEFGLMVKDLSLYDNTMVIGLANSQSGYIPKKEAFSQGGYEVRTAWTSQLVHEAGDILVRLVKEKILDNLSGQGVKAIVRKASDNKYLHKDFHLALNLLMTYVYDHFGKQALVNYLEQFALAYYRPLSQKLRSGDKESLVSYFKEIYEKEEWAVHIALHGAEGRGQSVPALCSMPYALITVGENSVEITQDACPAITHIVLSGEKPCPHYRETYNTVYKTICRDTPFEYELEYFNDETGACRQLFKMKEEKQ